VGRASKTTPKDGDPVMATIAAVVRISTKQSAVWRHCAGCDALAPLAPDQTHCGACRKPAYASRRPSAA
jgi:uncharacterized paraquat-inducible protein A